MERRERCPKSLDVWDEADPHWEQYAKYYEAPRHGGPLACVRWFIIPVIRDWLSKYWQQLMQGKAGRVLGDTLDKVLDLDEMRMVVFLFFRFVVSWGLGFSWHGCRSPRSV